YLINIGSPDAEIERKSIACLELELERCNTLGIDYLVLHPGSHVNTDEKSCLERISKNLNHILKKDTGKTIILLETMAGQGSSVCYNFDQLAYLLNNSQFKQRLGICFDTCHTFAAGYDISTQEKYNETLELFDQTIGLSNLKVF